MQTNLNILNLPLIFFAASINQQPAPLKIGNLLFDAPAQVMEEWNINLSFLKVKKIMGII